MKYPDKKLYQAPKLILHGSIEKITKAKAPGTADGGGSKS